MALVENLKKGFKDRESIHKATDSSYYIVYKKKGQNFFAPFILFSDS